MARLRGAPWRYQLVLTKCDLVPVADLARRVHQLQTSALAGRPKAIAEVLPVSAKRRAGLAALRAEIARFSGLAAPPPAAALFAAPPPGARRGPGRADA